jgi:hypothetical protein
MDGDADRPAVRLAEGLLLPVASGLAVGELLQCDAERPLPVDRVRIDDADVTPADHDDGIDVVGREHGLTRGQLDEGAGHDFGCRAVVDLDRDLGADEASERTQAARLAVVVQRLLPDPVAALPAGHAIADQLLGRHGGMADQQPVAPAGGAEVRDFRRAPERVGE